MKVYRFYENGVFAYEVDAVDGQPLEKFHTFEKPPEREGHYAIMRNGWALIEGAAPVWPIPPSDEDQREVSRSTRNTKLSECDWTQLPDVNLTADCKAAFATYRQALRDADMLNPVWPEAPAEEWVS